MVASAESTNFDTVVASAAACASEIRTIMPPPTTPCPHCGQGFFKHSLQFHVAQCARKQQAMITPCPACGMEMRNAELNLHMASCTAAKQRFSGAGGGTSRGSSSKLGRSADAERRGKVGFGCEDGSCGDFAAGCSGGGGGGAVSSKSVSASRPRAATSMAVTPAGPDGRVPCARCGRGFAPDRIAKHQFICAGLKHGESSWLRTRTPP